MPAFVLVEVSVHDPELYESYKKLTPGSLLPFGGKFLVRGGKTESLEGDWNPERLVILEFPSVELAKEWWSSEVYSGAKKIRYEAATSKMLVVETL
mgnify:CR=1 FL=1